MVLPSCLVKALAPRLVRAVPGLDAESLGGAVGINLAEFFEADGMQLCSKALNQATNEGDEAPRIDAPTE